jgi:hypothetical protein
MSVYRFLQDHNIGGVTYLAGTTASTADVGGTLPTGWVPSGQVDPLDPQAVEDFFNAGVQLTGPVRQQWSNQPVPVPKTYWVKTGPNQWSLTGLGSNLGFTNWTAPRGAWPG